MVLLLDQQTSSTDTSNVRKDTSAVTKKITDSTSFSIDSSKNAQKVDTLVSKKSVEKTPVKQDIGETINTAVEDSISSTEKNVAVDSIKKIPAYDYVKELILSPAKIDKLEPAQSLFILNSLKPNEIRPGFHESGKTWISIVLISVFAGVSIIKYFNSKKFTLLFSTLADQRGIVQMANDENELPTILKFNLSIIYFVILSVFIIQVISFYEVKPVWDLKLPLILSLILLIAGIFLAKIILLKTVAFIFEANKQVAEHLAINSSFSIITGLLLFPLVISLQYSSLIYHNFLVKLGITLISALILYRIIRIFASGWGILNVSKTHLFIYLCTLEIVPVLILLKIIKLMFNF